MEHGFVGRIMDRAVANTRVLQGAPEAIVLVGIVVFGVSYSGFQHFHRERVADLNGRLASQDRLLAEYRTKLTETGRQIEKLTTALADAEKNLRTVRDRPRSVENRSRDPGSLYEDNNPIAQVQDPKIDLDQKRITFPAVNSENLLQTNKLYQFQNWKLTCGGTRLYNMATDGASREFSYSPLTCKIVGSR
jgi:uncharacterized coiled-coil protein SlyX